MTPVRDPAQRVAGADAGGRATRGHEDAVRAILAKWDLTAAVIGEVIAEPVYRVTEGDRVVAEFPGSRSGHRVPDLSRRRRAESDAITRCAETDVHADRRRGRRSATPAWTLRRPARVPTIASKRWVYAPVRLHRCAPAPSWGRAAAMPRSCGCAARTTALALKTDGNGRYVYLDPRVGGRIAVAEAARNVACVGARPMAITNCLNFGNPTQPEVYFQLREAIAGMGEACRALGRR